MVVTRMTKIFAWIVVILLNFFFVYFSILRGLQRGGDWQRLYLMACIFRKFFPLIIILVIIVVLIINCLLNLFFLF